ncbi:GntR family transcriptional regulator [Aurantimonas sp. C2-6-R+9]|uniref:GntR family transcriptional regulator n=1 Tax=unclassified Aurantimonas TaxID=2638230 RepID=UPI002E194023|nr:MULTISPECIES: GntR family transcriptional regulator [unclassified Aurantimonas]MEC5290864.1 GntR family transcriptional regulator [Aurantimonas sp. C2-3-R2]MEC5381041.1 GntR family transcriptional regulator [Aurantimonas sp. C2-6-R+9]MEC5412014.1 GntR family transcriptional regulator [Aurantimonas sp. C2-4-R8]
MSRQSDLAAARIEELIMSGEFALGAHINEFALSARLGVGRAAIREACHALVRVGLVKIVPNQGAFVKDLSLLEITQIFDIRSSLGRLAGRQAALLIDAEGLSRLRGLIQEMDKVALDRDSERYVALNLDFHDALYKVSRNERLAELDRALGKELRIYRRHGLVFGGGLAVSNQEHREIMTAIEQGDCEMAGVHLEKHIRSGKERFLNAMSATGKLVLQSDTLAADPAKTKKKA